MGASTPIDSATTQAIVAIVFGLAATVIGGITIYQAHRSWKMWNEQRTQQRHGDMGLQDLELGMIDGPVSAVGSDNDVAANNDPPPPYVGREEHAPSPIQEAGPENDA